MIIITSKLRPNKILTTKLTTEKLFILVEPSELEAYQESFKDSDNVEIISLDKNEQGLGYSRWFAQDYATKAGEDVLWLFDDDITGINIRTEKGEKDYWKLRKIKPEEFSTMLSKMEDLLLSEDVTQLGLSFIASNWMYEGEVKYNTRCTQVFALNLKLLHEKGIYFDPEQIFYSDYDFTLNQLFNGGKTCRAYEYAFDTVLMNSNEGGCKAMRTDELTDAMCDKLIGKYGLAVVKKFYSDKHNLWEPKISWAKIVKKEKHGWW